MDILYLKYHGFNKILLIWVIVYDLCLTDNLNLLSQLETLSDLFLVWSVRILRLPIPISLIFKNFQ